jgi:hypothetical protein
MDLSQTVRVSPDVISQEVSAETVLLDLNSEHYFGLDEIGTRVWQLIKQHDTLAPIYHTLLEEFDVSEDTLRRDLGQLLSDIEQQGLIQLEKSA